jgi:hypothetical protein
VGETSGIHDLAQTVASSRSISWFARLGLSARAFVYLVMGILAIQIATGGRAIVDQRGALTKVLVQPFGTALVWLLAFGFAAYAIWRFSEAIYGVTGEGNGTSPRIHSLARGIAYGVLTRLHETVVLLGRVGTISRGVVFAVAGALVVVAAWSANSTKVGGIDEALRILLREPYGEPIVVLLGVGLILFGMYGLAQATWQRVSDGVAT